MPVLKHTTATDANINSTLDSLNRKSIWGINMVLNLITPKHYIFYVDDGSDYKGHNDLRCVSSADSDLLPLLDTWHSNAKSFFGFSSGYSLIASDHLLYAYYIENAGGASVERREYLQCASCLDTNCDATINSWIHNEDFKSILGITSSFSPVASDSTHYLFYITDPSSNPTPNKNQTLKREIISPATVAGKAALQALYDATNKKIIAINSLFGDAPNPLEDAFVFYLERN